MKRQARNVMHHCGIGGGPTKLSAMAYRRIVGGGAAGVV